MSEIERRFEAKIERVPEAGCWVWTAYINRGGYGVIGVEGHRTMLAHRFSYERFIGPIPSGLQLDHLCKNRCCVNPAHLEAVTPRVNTLRSDAVTAKNAFKTHCKRGHEFTEDNILPWSQPGRRCKTCEDLRCAKRRSTDEYKARNREYQRAYQRARYHKQKLLKEN